MKKMRVSARIFVVFVAVVLSVTIALACLTQTAWADNLGLNNESATYNVTFDANGGTVRVTEGSVAMASVLVNTDCVETAPIAVKEGMTFGGWYTNTSATGEKVVFPYYPTRAVTLYANYTAVSASTTQISTAEQLFDIRYNTTSASGTILGNYVLMNDINLDGAEWQPIGYVDTTNADGKQTRTDTPFAGTFDGNGYKIYNFKMTIDSNVGSLTSGYLSKGLFAELNGGTISNVMVSDFTITISGDVSNFYVGALVGRIKEGTLSNCKVSGSIVNPKIQYEESLWDDFFGSYATPTSNTYVGGMVGIVGSYVAEDDESYEEYKTSYISNCYSGGSITSESVADNVYIGGLIGYNSTAVVRNCSSYTDVKGRYAGGLMGYNENVVSACYAGGTLNCNLAYPTIAGGLIAYNDIAGSISRCYALGAVTARTAGGLVGVNMFSFVEASGGISNCYSIGDVVAAEYGGGLIGRTESTIPINGRVDYNSGLYTYDNGITTSLFYINHCMSFGDVSVSVKDVYYTENTTTNGVYHSVFAGGLIGHASEPLVASCIAFGDVTAISERPTVSGDAYVYNSVYANNLIGHSTNEYVTADGSINTAKNAFKAVYAIANQAVTRNTNTNYLDFNSVPSISYANANSQNYLTNSDGLAFDNSIWNFSALDIANGVYPTFR